MDSRASFERAQNRHCSLRARIRAPSLSACCSHSFPVPPLPCAQLATSCARTRNPRAFARAQSQQYPPRARKKRRSRVRARAVQSQLAKLLFFKMICSNVPRARNGAPDRHKCKNRTRLHASARIRTRTKPTWLPTRTNTCANSFCARLA